jgi:hypothetical protein
MDTAFDILWGNADTGALRDGTLGPIDRYLVMYKLLLYSTRQLEPADTSCSSVQYEYSSNT